ncbi:MAG: hypothetical protein L0312_28485 [Acidobacteria bacterium]|nr:hypothetical protein [Acidobacteriota bacterium]MCI0724037.1 hypothetical protein [Acidobacteriota bacterium]
MYDERRFPWGAAIHAGTEPSRLFISRDDGRSWWEGRALMEEGIKKFAEPQMTLLKLIAQNRTSASRS